MDDILQLLLQRPEFNTDLKLVCNLALTSKVAMSAAQNASNGSLDVAVDDNAIISFTSWLARYGGLVRSIAISSKGEGRATEINQMLRLGLQVAMLSEPQLQLQSYSSRCYGVSAVKALTALTTLTNLSLSNVQPKDVMGISAALQQLRSLQALELSNTGLIEHCLDRCMPAVHQLSSLTALTLAYVSRGFNPLQLPLQLQVLVIKGIGPFVLRISHLSRLQHLDVTASRATYELPVQLKRWVIQDNWATPVLAGLRDLMSLTKLESLNIEYALDSPQSLLLLTRLSSLKHLGLSWYDARTYKPAALVFGHLSMLRSIDLRYDDVGSFTSPEELMLAASAAKSLTRLKFECLTFYGRRAVSICHYVSQLPQLEDFEIRITGYPHQMNLEDRYECDCHMAAGDVQELSALTRLTSLRLNAAGMSDDDLVVLVRNLRQLQVLAVPFSAVSPAIIGDEASSLTHVTFYMYHWVPMLIAWVIMCKWNSYTVHYTSLLAHSQWTEVVSRSSFAEYGLWLMQSSSKRIVASGKSSHKLSDPTLRAHLQGVRSSVTFSQ